MLTGPLRDRFGLTFRLDPYSPAEIETIAKRTAGILGHTLEHDAAALLGRRCRGTPRVVNRVVRRCRDVAQVRRRETIDVEVAEKTLSMLGLDAMGLDEMDRRILSCILEKFEGGPVGLSTLSAALNEQTDTLEEVYEPYLIQLGFLSRTPRGRVVTPAGARHLGIPLKAVWQESLL